MDYKFKKKCRQKTQLAKFICFKLLLRWENNKFEKKAFLNERLIVKNYSIETTINSLLLLA